MFRLLLALLLFPFVALAQVAPTPNIANTPLGEVNTEGLRPTYTACGFVALTASGDAGILQGSATRIVHVTRISVDGIITAAATGDVVINRRSTGPTGGTQGGADAVSKADINDPAPTAAFSSYTTPPTAGTAAGVIRRGPLSLSTAAGTNTPLVFDFATRAEKGILLRGTSDYIAITMPSAAAGAGNQDEMCFTWIEENP